MKYQISRKKINKGEIRMMEESELLRFIIEEVGQRFDRLRNELEEIITETLGWSPQSSLLPIRGEYREKVIAMLDYKKTGRITRITVLAMFLLSSRLNQHRGQALLVH